MNAMKGACEQLGGISHTARHLHVSPPTVSQWITGTRPVPPARAVALERLLERRIRRWEFRPNDWWVHWPELIGTEGAPQVPAAAQPTEHAEA